MDTARMKSIEVVGAIDEHDRLRAQVPHEDDAGVAWAQGVGTEWSDELWDSSQDIYTLEDGEAVNAPR
jgi:hypothetical protein